MSATLIIGIVLVALALSDAFETVIFPRRVTRRLRLTRLYFRYSWRIWSSSIAWMVSGRRRESLLSLYGPLSLPLLLALWAFMLISGFALLFHTFGPLAGAGEPSPGFLNALYFSATTFFTLGLGDVIPATPHARLLAAMEVGVGFIFLAMIIGYFPALNQSFSRREISISLLDARAGSPPTAAEILRRNSSAQGAKQLEQFLHDWEYWAAELLESHLTYPVLAYFRSQHDNQSWLAALTAILDTSALVMAAFKGDCERQSELTFAIARHAVVDLALIFETPPEFTGPDRLPPANLERIFTVLTNTGSLTRKDGDANPRLTELRALYEPYVNALSRRFHLALPAWISETAPPDNWLQSAWFPRKHVKRPGSSSGIIERHF